ncbi:WD40/YVTN/BNR-like repeat-containing protein [Evansella sp. AB-rgal1]|uniref:WD40/YVTN/BNR-like repeat-containing protein n=1 Tax=Evansella sp. AB-rgal1 TaxID=3242696 RepID=UPI00359E9E1A
MSKKQLRLYILFLVLCFASLLVFQLNQTEEDDRVSVPDFDETMEDIASRLPYTLEVYERDTTPEIKAYRILFDFMKGMEAEGIAGRASYVRFTRLSGDEEEFEVAVVLHVSGPIDVEGEYDELVWILTIEKVENLTYSITNIEETDDRYIGLPPVESLEEYEMEAGLEAYWNYYTYQLTDTALQVTYNNGETWTTVPVERDDLLEIDFRGQLVKGSYVISEERTAFLLNRDRYLIVFLSEDMGKTWEEVVVPIYGEVGRLAILGFTSEQEGYLFVTGERTMSFEAHFIFKTDDGGKTWEPVNPVSYTNRMMTDGGFIMDQLGFVSFGEHRTEGEAIIPYFYRTENGGESWEPVDAPVPEEYAGYFIVAEIPTFQGDEGTLLVNQGPEGDYLGGKVLAKFTSEDQGKTWTFYGLVDPDGVLE